MSGRRLADIHERWSINTSGSPVTLEGQTYQKSLDLGVWETFYLRPFSPEPHALLPTATLSATTIYPRRQAKKAVYASAPHDTSYASYEKFKRKETITRAVPKLGKAHQHGTPNAQERRRHVLHGIQGQDAWLEKHSEAPPGNNSQVGSSTARPHNILLPNILEEFLPY
ncbi:hypothetical protein GWK47_031522 [Chionoecetes opilio]|uniref:Uncharacterized protein n=1 Tax=Chionoecetes opilio TaxID=41210 RepID=A0A8J4Z0V8_CHIOP|nr:hypothetical protein GWK47_031522 [Chionoecetes opilio]